MARRADPGRRAVLGAIRGALGRQALTPDGGRELEARLRRHPASLVPAQGKPAAGDRLAQFQAKAEAVACTVARLDNSEEIPAAVADYLRRHNLEPELTLAPEPWLEALPWQEQPLLRRADAGKKGDVRVALTAAFAGVAETGTLVTLSGPTHPTGLNFLPEHHIVALRASQVVGAYEEAWAALRRTRKKGRGFTMPRSLNMITGPSRTGDIELTIHLGAHGPRGVHILLIDDEGEDGGET